MNAKFHESFNLNEIISKVNPTNSKIPEIPISDFLDIFTKKYIQPNVKQDINKPNFYIEETTSSEESCSIFYKESNQNIYVSIFGPREQKIKEKTDPEKCNIEINLKFTKEYDKEFIELLSKKTEQFIKSVILLNSYPKSQIVININVFNNNYYITKYDLYCQICNAVVICLCLSGINLIKLIYGRKFVINDKEGIIFVNINELKDDLEIFDLDYDKDLNLEEIEQIQNESKIYFDLLYKKLKSIIFKKLQN
jgi:ribonuclease PH